MRAALYWVVPQPLNILAVDDNDSIRAAMSFIFPAPRYRVETVSNGNGALRDLEENPGGYDVIIVDQKMPQMTGVQLVDQMRKRGLAGKVLVLSAHLTDEARDAYAQMNVRDILTKPFDIQQLRTAVDAVAA